MSDSLLPWYERELSLLYSESQWFAQEHPQLARHLGISHSQMTDPHIARLCEAIALLNARLSKQLAEESTQLSSSLLNILFPLSIQPLPSACMIAIPPSADLTEVATMASGTEFRAYVDQERFCRFRTTRDVQLCPFDIQACRFELRPFSFQHIPCPDDATAVLCLELGMLDTTRVFSELAPFDELCLHFTGLAPQQARFYDDLCRNRCTLMLINNEGEHYELSSNQFEVVGFSGRDWMMATDNKLFTDAQVMLELFTWPELFFAFRLGNLGNALQSFTSQQIALLIFFEQANDELITAVDSLTFSPGLYTTDQPV